MEDNRNIEKRKETELEEALQLWMEIRGVDREKGWKRLKIALPLAGDRHVGGNNLRGFRKIAAVIVLLLAVGGGYWLWRETGKEMAESTVVVTQGQPRLILNNGQQIPLGKGEDVPETSEVEGIRIDRKDKRIVYAATDSVVGGTLDYNTLEIPRGTEYKLILADGTQVWLNVQTRLRYPVSFGSGERRVYLEGEAYFEVTKDAGRPFRVESAAQTVEVLGTQFNVYAYPDEQQVYTTLVEGSVAVTAVGSGKQMNLKPGEQTVVEAEHGDMAKSKVNIEEVISWKNGMFVFDDQSLEIILGKVARWYDVEVFYKNVQAKTLVFKGNLPRYGELSELLKVLESGSQVRFAVKGRSLVVE